MDNENKIICPVEFDEFLKGHSKYIYLNIPGIAIAKQRPRAVRRGKFIQIYTPNETKNYEKKVERKYREIYSSKDTMEGPLSVKVEGCFPIPSSISKKAKEEMLSGRVPHIKKPDCDNLAKTPLDALNGVAYNDDSQIINLQVSKKYGENPYLTIKIIEERGNYNNAK